MPQAQITINAVIGSEVDAPINTLAQFDNNNVGGELTFTWSILDQPAGPADALSSTTIQNPTLTPLKEGTYLVKLVVNQGLPDEQVDIVVAAVRQLKTRERIPAAGETTETDVRGWADDLNSLWRRVDRLISDNITEIVAEAASNIAQGDVVRISGVATIKAGLPGEEDIFEMDKALATVPADIDSLLAVVEENVDGTTSVLAGELMKVRLVGLFSQTLAGSPAIGDPVFVSDTGTLSLTPGTNTRRVGEVIALPTGATFRIVVIGGLPLPLAVSAPPDVDKSAASAGVSSSVARADHKHDIVTAVPVTIGILSAEGVAAALARADHVHKGQIRQLASISVLVDTTTTLASFVNLLQLLPVVDASSKLLIIATFGADNTLKDNSINFRLRVDTTVVAGTNLRISGDGEAQGGSLSFKTAVLPLGGHNIELQWATSGSTARVRPMTSTNENHATLTIFELLGL